ncbi:MAG: FAD-dependent oxidoreductase [Deltaproteobacteria bacterium]|nr:FAD-dependent oxidoreductase [Deltaproteobacteria bacterium]
MVVSPPLPPSDTDVIVVGGGVNGTGVARDCSLRGLRVVLLERNDLGHGASGNSSGMIHGGPRYLSSNPSVTRMSCLDSGFIQRIAPHLLFRIPFIMPIDRGVGSGVFFTLVDAFFGAYDKFQVLKRGKPHSRLTPDETRQLEPGLTSDMIGAVSFDEWGIDGSRLCAANAIDASEHGASIHVHTTVDQVVREPKTGRACAVRWTDRCTGASGSTKAKLIVNATGAWGSITASLAGLSPMTAAMRPGKGIHVVFDRRLSNHAVAVQTIDDRQVFTEPWENVSVLGTTDTDYYGDLDDVHATSDEVRYLVQAMAHVMPSIRSARIIGTFAGVRPTLYKYGPIPDALSREHEIVDHAAHGADGLYSMIGGKLASYRLFAEEMSDVVARRLGIDAGCSTHTHPLPGGDRTLDPSAFAAAHDIDPVAARRLIYRHGSRAERVGELMLQHPVRRAMVCLCEAVSDAEIRYVVRSEFARSVDDVARRTRLGAGPCGGMRCALRCGAIVAEELGLDPRHGVDQARAFALRTARSRAVALGPLQARQEALAIAAFRAQAGLPGGRA